MLYLGLTMTKSSIEKWLGPQFEKRFKGLSIGMHYLDKGIYVVGIPLECAWNNLWTRGNTFFQTLLAIHEAKIHFDKDLAKLGVNLIGVQIDFMEDGCEIRDAEPTLIEYSFG